METPSQGIDIIPGTTEFITNSYRMSYNGCGHRSTYPVCCYSMAHTRIRTEFPHKMANNQLQAPNLTCKLSLSYNLNELLEGKHCSSGYRKRKITHDRKINIVRLDKQFRLCGFHPIAPS
ncbi:hypothetical protein CEXT_4281 [Caerostris extrusa]|uniref:Uncharacterized protein n=1 Tax=Caerostris extrusa TaxID=172846 RepID=A0AAV4N7C7_CAEEX|nr:hypothetical protein CEXT_4281 [Caerostris extrusa]